MSGYLETCRGCGMRLQIDFSTAGGRLVEVRPPCLCPAWEDGVPSRLAAASLPRQAPPPPPARRTRLSGAARVARNERVKELLEAGALSCEAIGDVVGLGRHQVGAIARELGIDISNPWRARKAGGTSAAAAGGAE